MDAGIDGVIAVTGRTGQGKGLCSVGLARGYLLRGKTVVTNMDLFPENFTDIHNDKIRIIRIPDIITIDVLDQLSESGCIGLGNPSPEDGDENSLLLVDEVAIYLNSQDWNKPHVKPVVDWLRHRRKYGYDVAMQIQDIESLNSQVQRAVVDYELKAIKVVSLPVISTVYRWVFKKRFKLPKSMRYHKAKMRNLETDLVEDNFRYQAKDIYPLYDTKQRITEDYEHGIHSLLTPWHLVGRYSKPPMLIKDWLLLPVKFLAYISLEIARRIQPNIDVTT